MNIIINTFIILLIVFLVAGLLTFYFDKSVRLKSRQIKRVELISQEDKNVKLFYWQ